MESKSHTDTVFIVSGTPENKQILTNILTNNAYILRSEITGSEALVSIKNELPDLILMEMELPDMKGIEVYKLLKVDENTCQVPVLFLINENDASEKQKVFEAGGVDYITKPFIKDEVLARVKIQLEISKLRSTIDTERQLRTTNEKVLKESEERFQLLFNKAPLGYQSLDKNGCFIEVNQKWLDMLGYTHDEVIGKWFGHFMPPKYQEMVKINFPKFLAQGHIHAEFELIHKNGSIHYIAFDGKIGTDINGNFKQTHCILQDITESKRIKDALVESERRFRTLLSGVELISIMLDMEGCITFCNDYLLTITGYTKEEVIGKNWFEQFLPRSVYENVLNVYLEAIKNQNIIKHYENAIVTKNGEELIISWNNTALYDEQGKINSIASLGVDITQKQKAEQALLNNQKLLSETETLGNIGGWEVCVKTQKLNWTAQTYRIHEVPIEKEPTLDEAIKFYAPESLPIINSAVQKAIELGEPFDLELEIITAKGNRRNVHAIGKYDASLERVYGYFQDITERKRNEQALIDSEKKLITLFESMTEMVVIQELEFDENGNAINYIITDCNKTFLNETGIENPIGKLATEVYDTYNPPYLEQYAQVCKTGISYEFNSYYAPMEKHFLISAVSLGGNKFATITTDITSNEKVHEIIREKNKELENYIYIASHDLRSPLVNIQGFSERLEKQVKKLIFMLNDIELKNKMVNEFNKITNTDIPNSLQFILMNVSKMDTLINGLLQLSRTGQVKMQVSMQDMDKLIESILASYNFQLTELNVIVKKQNIEQCYGDKNQLNQLFSNIIGNALKYRDTNRQLILEITSSSHFNKVVYAIKDNGIGIKQRHIEKIWDVFYRVDASSAEAGEGLGLSLVKRIVEKHKGKIWAESTEEEGSTFYVELHKNEFEV